MTINYAAVNCVTCAFPASRAGGQAQEWGWDMELRIERPWTGLFGATSNYATVNYATCANKTQ